MCTIIVRHRIDDWCSTLIASNRDEFYDREATPPLVLSSTPRVVGGRDESKGGTWFGVTRGGLFVGLTNQRIYGFPDSSLRSRGELVLGALQTGSREGVRDFLEGVDARSYNEFNLIYGDGDSLEAAYGRQSSPDVEFAELSRGVHVLCNDRLGSPEFPKAEVARERVLSISPQPWESIAPALAEVLSDDSLPDPADVPPLPENAFFDEDLARRLQAIKVRTPIYGTVSATLAAVSPGQVHHYHFSETPPTADSFSDYTSLIEG
ncbi:MAG: NRDE family protein [Myxococcota bacterium]